MSHSVLPVSAILLDEAGADDCVRLELAVYAELLEMVIRPSWLFQVNVEESKVCLRGARERYGWIWAWCWLELA